MRRIGSAHARLVNNKDLTTTNCTMDAVGGYNMFQGELLINEQILWTGQPVRRILFTRSDGFIIPFSLLWGGFAIFWEISVVYSKASIVLVLLGIPFVLIGLYLLFGRFIYKYIQKKGTYYAVTNQRVLILTHLFKSIQAEYISQIPIINKTVRRDGIGTLRFGHISYMISIYGNTGIDFFGSDHGRDVPTFYDINNVDEVYRLVNDLRLKK